MESRSLQTRETSPVRRGWRRLVGCMVVLLGACALSAQTYDKMWEKVRRFEQQALPKSAYAEVERIREKAVREKNAGQEFASLLGGYMLQQEIVPDSFFASVADLEYRRRTTDSSVRKAVYSVVLGHLYAHNRYRSQVRTSEMAAHPDSLREWSAEQYDSAAVANCRLALEAPSDLHEARAKAYMPFVVQGKDAAYFNGDLLNVVGRQAIQVLRSTDRRPLSVETAEKIAAVMLDVYRKKGNREAELLVALDSISLRSKADRRMYWERETAGNGAEDEERRVLDGEEYLAYRGLLERFPGSAVAAEVYMAMLNLNVTPARKVEWAKEALQRYPGYARSAYFENVLTDLQHPTFQWECEGVYYPECYTDWVVTARNVTRLGVEVYKVNPSFDKDRMTRQQHPEDYVKKTGTRMDNFVHAFPKRPAYEEFVDTLHWFAPEPGRYVVVMKPEPGAKTRSGARTACNVIRVSRMKVVTQSYPDGQLMCTVVDAMKGSPVADADVAVYCERNGQRTLFRQARTDARGQLLLPAKPSHTPVYVITAKRGEDMYLPETEVWGQAGVPVTPPSRSPVNVNLYTDRSIYRPGQLVHVGGIVYKKEGEARATVEGEELALSCWDVNGRMTEEKTVKTDAYGVFAEDFRLPEQAALGVYRIKGAGAVVWFRVEEYKRPTFRVDFDPVKERYVAGDTVTVTGEVRAFSGAPCRNARLTGQGRWQLPWWRMNGVSVPELRLDTVYTDGSGRFSWRIPLDIDKEILKFGGSLDLTAEALSTAGETQAGAFTLPVGNVPLELAVFVNEKQDKERLQPWKFRLTTLNGSMAEGTVRYALFPDSVATKKGGAPVLEAQADANVSFLPEQLRRLPSGRYLLQASVVSEGDTLCRTSPVVLFCMADARPAASTDFWYYCPADTFDVSGPAQVQVGSSFRDVCLYYSVFSGTRLLDSGVKQFSDSLLTFTYPYKEEYGDGLTVLYAFVKDNKVYQQQAHLKYRVPDTRLRMHWAVFRDKLQPGGQEEWRLRILTPDGKPAQANLMAALYDATLDRLTGSAHTWSLFVPVTRRLPYQFWKMQSVPRVYSSLYFMVKRKRVNDLSFDEFNSRFLSGLFFSSGGSRAKYALAAMGRAEMKMEAYDTVEDLRAVENSALMEPQAMRLRGKIAGTTVTEEAEDEDGGEAGALEPVASLRTDFSETAFFYPRLRTDGQGDVSMVFTLPESLTTWNFIGVAHTEDMNVGTIQATAVAQKDFMAQLHVPRFVRAGDRMTVTATLNNLTDRVLKGKARLELFDPVSEKVVYREKQSFEAENVTVLSFTVNVDGRYDLLACRIVAESGDFSDGEQYYLPVLSDKEWVTESVDIHLTEKGKHAVDVSSLLGDKPQAERRSLTVEYTTSPVWYAVQALPALDNPAGDDALSQAAAYYGASVAAYIARTTPRLQAVVESWKAQGGTAETLWSNLQRDETLKGIVLSETPWVMQAENEAANRRNLVALFDVNMQANRRSVLLERLKGMQQADGSFAWFPGMKGNEYITREVAELLVRLRILTGEKDVDAEADRMSRTAWTFLKKKNDLRVADMRKAEAKGLKITFPGEDALHYLYITVCGGRTAADLKNVEYLLARLEKGNPEVNNEQRALAAVVLNQAGKKDAARKFAASLKEHMTQAEARGVYLEYPGGSFTSIDRKLAIHVQAMEAIEAVMPADRSTLDGMRRWLLQQKRVQSWSTPVNSANAVYALLHGNRTSVAVQGADSLTLCLGKTAAKIQACIPVEGDETAVGLGYVKQSFVGSGLAGTPQQVIVEKASEGESWGSATARYLIPAGDVKAASTGLTVRREVSTQAPRVGEKLVVRYVITADRDYEYVVLKDGRAACCEPVEGRFGYVWRNGLGYYRMVRDASTEYYIDRLPKGTYVIETMQYVDRPGTYSAGLATLQCVYAAEFTSHTGNIRLNSKR